VARGSRTVGVVIDRETDEAIQRAMREMNLSQSDVLRYAIQRGLDIVSAEEAGYKAGVMRGRRQFREALAQASADVVDTD